MVFPSSFRFQYVIDALCYVSIKWAFSHDRQLRPFGQKVVRAVGFLGLINCSLPIVYWYLINYLAVHVLCCSLCLLLNVKDVIHLCYDMQLIALDAMFFSLQHVKSWQ